MAKKRRAATGKASKSGAKKRAGAALKKRAKASASKKPTAKKAAKKKAGRKRAVTAKAAAPARLRGVSDIRRFFHRNRTPVFFVSATNFNLLGIDEWVGNFWYLNYIDCFDGGHPSVFVPKETPHAPFESIEDINNYLLSHKETIDFIRSRGERPKAVFLMFNEETERICKEIGLEVCFPPARLREAVDHKIGATRIAERAGVPCVPNVLAKVDSWKTLRRVSRRLGCDLVVQTPFGDSGHTTFFISNEEDWAKHAEEIVAAPEVKVMKRIRCRGSALEACVTRHGTIVGPLMTELIGFPELTPYRGGWCGNEVHAEAFDRRTRQRAREAAMRFGDELRRMGYKGYFEIDFLTDIDTGKIYLGEVNPRLTGASSMTNLAVFAHADAPLFLFHLLEWMDVPYDLDIGALNARWADPDNIDTWSQLVLKHNEDTVDRVAQAPQSGIWELRPDGSAEFVRPQTHRRTVYDENRAFYFRITGPGDWRAKGSDLGILVSRGRFMNEDHTLNERAKAWIRAIRGRYVAGAEGVVEPKPAFEPAEVGGFKIY
ncbi:MAG: biotin carboxylase [Phycisphaerales bacterium]|nr:biotin carboxylase [Phycisphaerales bacterium]